MPGLGSPLWGLRVNDASSISLGSWGRKSVAPFLWWDIVSRRWRSQEFPPQRDVSYLLLGHCLLIKFLLKQVFSLLLFYLHFCFLPFSWVTTIFLYCHHTVQMIKTLPFCFVPFSSLWWQCDSVLIWWLCILISRIMVFFLKKISLSRWKKIRYFSILAVCCILFWCIDNVMLVC